MCERLRPTTFLIISFSSYTLSASGLIDFSSRERRHFFPYGVSFSRALTYSCTPQPQLISPLARVVGDRSVSRCPRTPTIPLRLTGAVVIAPPTGRVGVVAGGAPGFTQLRRAAVCFSGYSQLQYDMASWRLMDDSIRSAPISHATSPASSAAENDAQNASVLCSVRPLSNLCMSTLYSPQVENSRFTNFYI